jgi:hypothetical protein
MLCLPGILICAWYGWNAFSAFDSYRRFVDPEIELGVADFQLSLHDTVSRDLRRMRLKSAPEDSRFERFELHLPPDSWNAIYGGNGPDQTYVPAELDLGKKLQPVELRLRGSKHWHVLSPQRSIKVRLPQGELYDGHRVFNLINDPNPMIVGEELILDLARESGVLTPRSTFARVVVNGSDLGVMRFETQPDEGLLRLRHRMPGSIYSSNLSSDTATKQLWSGTEHWRKAAWRRESEKTSFAELERLLERIGHATTREFVDFARSEIDLESFATHDAVDVIFGGDQHDFRDNHKLYFDPYRGKFEPVASNFRGYKHEAYLNLVESPILLRLKYVPEYLSTRARILHDLLVGEGRVAAVKRRGRKIFRRLAPELMSDRYFDAYKMLPGVDRFHRQMMRPMDIEDAVLVFESEISTYATRHAFLVKQIQKNPLWIVRGETRQKELPVVSEIGLPIEPQPPSYAADFELVVDGQAGVSLEEVRVSFADDCEDPWWRVWFDGRPLEELTLQLHPRVELVAREDPGRAEGEVRALAAPASYPFQLESSCPPTDLRAWGTHLATGTRVRSRPVPDELLARVPKSPLGADEVPRFAAGEASPDPHKLLEPAPRSVRLGPGDVEVRQTRVYGSHQSVEVAAGTRLRMAGGTSLIFLGPVRFAGSEGQPVVVEGAGQEPWGGIAIQGRATAGSTLEHVIVRGGTVPAWRLVPYPGTVDIHDTERITLRHCRFGGNREADDMVHAVYVDDLVVEDCLFEDTAGDAIDLEFVDGALRRVEMRRLGDDGLDLMGSDVVLADSVVVGCAGYGVSAGEETEARVRDSLLAACETGVLAKNASAVALTGALLYDNRVGVRLYKRTVRYAGDSRVDADTLYAVNCDRTGRTDDESSELLFLGRVERRIPGDGSLDHLLEDVLGLSDPEQVERFVTERRGEAGR